MQKPYFRKIAHEILALKPGQVKKTFLKSLTFLFLFFLTLKNAAASFEQQNVTPIFSAQDQGQKQNNTQGLGQKFAQKSPPNNAIFIFQKDYLLFETFKNRAEKDRPLKIALCFLDKKPHEDYKEEITELLDNSWSRYAFVSFTFPSILDCKKIKKTIVKQPKGPKNSTNSNHFDGVFNLILNKQGLNRTSKISTSKSLQVSINFAQEELDEDNEEPSRSVWHEFGHALGLDHTLFNPNSDLTWNIPELKKKCKKIYKGIKKKVDNCVRQRAMQVSQLADEQFYEFDPYSIMRYTIPTDLLLGKKALDYSPEKPMKLSLMDKLVAEFLYPGKRLLGEAKKGLPDTLSEIQIYKIDDFNCLSQERGKFPCQVNFKAFSKQIEDMALKISLETKEDILSTDFENLFEVLLDQNKIPLSVKTPSQSKNTLLIKYIDPKLFDSSKKTHTLTLVPKKLEQGKSSNLQLQKVILMGLKSVEMAFQGN